MAEKTESLDAITEATSERVERITLATAAGEVVSAEDQAWIEDFNAKQEIFEAALTEGRHFEISRFEDPEENLVVVKWTESIPMPDGSMLFRFGVDEIKLGVSEDVIRTVRYFEPGKISPTGTITSIISGGYDQITGITGFGPGGEYAGLQIGDTRPSLLSSTTAAGTRPSSWDPANFGTASGGGSAVPGLVDPLQQSIDSFVDQALGQPLPGAQSGGTSQSSGSSQPDSSGSSQPDSSDREGTGLLDPTDRTSSSESSEADGPDGGGKMPDNVDPDPGTDDQGGGDEEGDRSSAQEGSDPDAGASGDLGGGGDEQKPASEPAQPSESSPEDVEFTAYGVGTDSFDHVENVNTGQVGAEAGSDIVTTQGYVAPVEGHWEDSDERTVDDYSTSSPAIPKPGAPIDYGDTTDPNYDPIIPTPDAISTRASGSPLILVDPSSYEISTTGRITEPDTSEELQNYGDPLEQNQALAPGSGIPSTSEQEYIGGDAMAATGPEMAGSVEEEGPDEGALGAMGGDDPLP